MLMNKSTSKSVDVESIWMSEHTMAMSVLATTTNPHVSVEALLVVFSLNSLGNGMADYSCREKQGGHMHTGA